MELNIPLYEEYVSCICPELLGDPSKEHYRLLAHLSTLFENQNIIDIGTHTGYSAYALAYNDKNIVHTFDIVEKTIDQRIKNRVNIKFNLHNLFIRGKDDPWVNTVLGSPLIFMDVDPHEGHIELEFYEFLRDNNYQGLVVCDDIWYFKSMRDNFWYQIPKQYKHDLTMYGHWSGTGVISFTNKYDNLFQIRVNNDDWTLVTAYFDLNKYYDANPSMRKTQYYMNHAQSVMSCPYNLIVYCDEENLERIKKLRPSYLHDKTHYIVLDFDELKFVGHDGYENITFKTYRSRISQNRQDKPYQFDPRNNASYYLFCIARNLLLKKTIDTNPFKSTHFAWINICIERMGFKNLIHLDEALSLHRDKFSTLYIDYIPKSLIDDTDTYFHHGRCSMCSGFYTGDIYHMYKVCHEIEKQFLEYLDQGYGHADEQLFSPVYFKYPELFEHYYGDYSEMITNYCYIYDNPAHILATFIRNSFNNQFYVKCHESCKCMWKSYLADKCSLDTDQLKQLLYYKNYSKLYQLKKSVRPLTKSAPIPCVHKNDKQSTIITLLYNVGNFDRVKMVLTQAHQWLKLTFPIIIWTDDTYYDTLKTIFHNKNNVKIYKKNIDEFDTFGWHEKICSLYHIYPVINRNNEKDTIIYHMLMYARPEMWAQSIADNPFNTDTFICMDFGLTRFTTDLSVVENWVINPKVKMLMINPYLQVEPEPRDYFTVTYHNVAGGMVTGSGQNIVELVKLFRSELKQMINEEWCQLDEALMACITRKYPNLCDFYYGDYCGIISNYEKTRDMTNVSPIIQKYLDNGLYTEAQTVIDTIDYKFSDECMDVFISASILANYYTKNGQLDPIVRDILCDPIHAQYVTDNASNLKFYGL